MSKYEWGGVESVGAYHERERLCPEGVRVMEIAHVHYGFGVFCFGAILNLFLRVRSRESG